MRQIIFVLLSSSFVSFFCFARVVTAVLTRKLSVELRWMRPKLPSRWWEFPSRVPGRVCDKYPAWRPSLWWDCVGKDPRWTSRRTWLCEHTRGRCRTIRTKSAFCVILFLGFGRNEKFAYEKGQKKRKEKDINQSWYCSWVIWWHGVIIRTCNRINNQ